MLFCFDFVIHRFVDGIIYFESIKREREKEREEIILIYITTIVNLYLRLLLQTLRRKSTNSVG